MNVRVVGEQFTWTFYYRGEGGDEISSPQLYLPANTPVNFTVQSKDVIHDFWVPAFRMKIDAVPGIDTHVRVTTTDRLGEFPVVCAELCGLGHSTMRQSAHVMTPRGLRRASWPSSPAGPPRAAAVAAAAARPTARPCSRTPRSRTACDSCHTLADAGATGTTGPNLDEVARRPERGRDPRVDRRA